MSGPGWPRSSPACCSGSALHGLGSLATHLIPLGFLGFVLCIVRWKTRSLYPCIALHSANNALALGHNQLNWNALEILGLVLASWLVVGSLTLPLAARAPRTAWCRGPSRGNRFLTPTMVE